MSRNKLLSRIAYACGTFGHDIFYAMVTFYFVMFVTSNLFNTSDESYNAYMIGIVTTLILIIRIAELLTHSSVILLIKQKLNGVNSNHGLSQVVLLRL